MTMTRKQHVRYATDEQFAREMRDIERADAYRTYRERRTHALRERAWTLLYDNATPDEQRAMRVARVARDAIDADE